ncbi:MAG: hypothetical protein DRG82_06540 [Deltaproteobacteria bacterium]|nr:MAG: hypothetical protein DRG82_06540 [Deltaproteobacteria bacterium]HDZ90667.1 hypothetical protein [Deltaproteobacteria bacterium]
MAKKKTDSYIKHVYWVTKEEEKELRSELEARGRKLKSAKGIVCTPLDPINKIASVAPEVWGDTCSRQGSWYRHSNKNGRYLIISSFELEDYRDRKEAVITVSDFVPPRLATDDQKNDLVKDPLIQEMMPDEWRHVEDIEKRIYLRWARRLGSDVENYDFLYLSHTANHANFIHPRFFVEDGTGIVPYSIDRSAHLCSCCLELFQVLGGQHKKKMVAPCPGATIFARLKPDRYLQVERP